jgi:hypothetical protein
MQGVLDIVLENRPTCQFFQLALVFAGAAVME